MDGIGRTQIIIGVAILAVLALVTIPLWLGSSTKARRSECPTVVDSIRTTELKVYEAFGEYVSADAAPRARTAVDQNAVPWASNKGFNSMSWDPMFALGLSELYGSYSVAATEDGFTVTGVCDVDGDGQRATFTATKDTPATMTTPENVY